MENNNAMVLEFTEAMKQPVAVPTIDKDGVKLFQLRCRLIAEEAQEVMQAAADLWTTIYKPNNRAAYEARKADMLKELMDLMYVVEGMCVTYGWDSDEAFKRVHGSNMSKLGSEKDKDGKVMKGDNYYEPDLSDLVLERGCTDMIKYEGKK
jgi:predicted HAD superfamily Cof-like phosphohydrolase